MALAVSGQWGWLPLSLAVWAVVVWKHRENIVRLRSGTEKSWLKSKNKGAAAGNAAQGDDTQNMNPQDAGRKDG